MFNLFNSFINRQQNNHNDNHNDNNNDNHQNNNNIDASLTIFYTPTIFYYDVSDISQFDNMVFVLINNNISKQEYKKIATMREIKQINKIIYTLQNTDIPDECPITLNKFEIGQEISQLRCGHCFDSNAIIKWLRTSSNQCPVCRYSFNWKLI